MPARGVRARARGARGAGGSERVFAGGARGGFNRGGGFGRAAAATTTSEVEAAAISEAAEAAEEDSDEGAVAEALTKAKIKDLQNK